jgi:hypothetical protein
LKSACFEIPDDEKKSADPDKIAATPTRAAEKKGTSTTAAKAAAAGTLHSSRICYSSHLFTTLIVK